MKDYDWKPLRHDLPTERDFDPYGGDLDAQYAWREFGGKSLVEAYDHFLESPENRQEDFMFMGPKAFYFYFPVIERYLREVRTSGSLDDCQAWILGQVFYHQLEGHNTSDFPHLRERIAQLSKYVKSHLDQYAIDDQVKADIDLSWAQVERLF